MELFCADKVLVRLTFFAVKSAPNPGNVKYKLIFFTSGMIYLEHFFASVD